MLKRLSPDAADQHAAIDWVGRAREVAPLIAGAADRIERDLAIAEEVLAGLHDRALFRLLLPRAFGGAEVEPAVYLAVIEEIAKADASTAWCLGQACGGSIAAAYLPPDVARDIFGDPRAVVASGPSFGTAITVEGGYRASGAWGFASGSKHAGWLAAHCLVREADGTPRLEADGTPAERTFFFRKDRATFTEIWRVIGLCGTGSDRFAIDDLFVPDDYSYTREAAAERRESGPLYRISSYHLFGVGFAGVALGIARATLDSFIALARQKTPTNAPQTLRDNASVQFQVGLAETRLQAARAFLVQTLREIWDVVAAGESVTLDQRASLRMAITNASQQSREVVDAAYHAAGATAIFDSNVFERRFRDMHTVSQQVQAHSSNFELIGQHLLGLSPRSKFL
ncbi:MAG: acyl-CoA dehydrogenase family protein [Xanthobacteraceae bacterium]